MAYDDCNVAGQAARPAEAFTILSLRRGRPARTKDSTMSNGPFDYVDVSDSTCIRRYQIPRNSCIIVDGDTPTICPNADPAPRIPLFDLEAYYRQQCRLKPSQTIHWVGTHAYEQNACRCVSSKRAAGPPGA